MRALDVRPGSAAVEAESARSRRRRSILGGGLIAFGVMAAFCPAAAVPAAIMLGVARVVLRPQPFAVAGAVPASASA